MLCIETHPAMKLTNKYKIARTGMLYAYVFCQGMCLLYGVLRWIQVEGFLLPFNFIFPSLRIIVLLVVGAAIGVSMLIGRTRWFQEVGESLRTLPIEKLPPKDSKDLPDHLIDQNSTKSSKDDPPAKKVTTVPQSWKVFERSLFFATGILLLLSFLESSALCNGLFSSNCNPIPLFLEYPIVGDIIDGLGSLDLVVLLGYGSIKVPLLVRNVMDQHSRVYIGHWHIHESVFGIVWVLIAGFWILFGDYYDRFIGFALVLQGMFLLGRDHADVEKFKFAEKRKPGA